MIHLLLVNEMNLLADVIADAVESEPDIMVTGIATSVDEAIAQASEADVALVCTRLPGSRALRLTRALAG